MKSFPFLSFVQAWGAFLFHLVRGKYYPGQYFSLLPGNLRWVIRVIVPLRRSYDPADPHAVFYIHRSLYRLHY